MHCCRLHNFVGVGRSSVCRTHAFPSRFSMDNSTMAPGVLVDSTNVTRTIWRLRWTNVASYHLIWKRWWVTEQTGDPRASQQCKSSSHGVSMNWRPNVIYENLVHQPPATFSARSVTGCAVLILDLLHMSSPTQDDETRRIDGSVHNHYNARHMLWCAVIVKCGIARFLCAMCVFEVRTSSSSPRLPVWKILFLSRPDCWASPRKKIAYLITQSPSLFDAPGTEVFTSEQDNSLKYNTTIATVNKLLI